MRNIDNNDMQNPVTFYKDLTLLMETIRGKTNATVILGGAAVGATPAEGVVDGYHRVFGHEGLHVIDGAAIGANLGVNPSLTITALAERAISMWPDNGEVDERPALGRTYTHVG